MKKAIVTGPTGVIGIALVKKLVEDNIEVYAVCRPNSSRTKTILKSDMVHIVECDLSKIRQLKEMIKQDCDFFYHLAWEGTMNPRNRFDMYLQNRNIKFTLDAVETAHDLNCKVFVGAGSQAEYGVGAEIMKPETYTSPISGYGMAKLCAGQMTRHMCQQYGMKHIWARILSVYGVGDGKQTLICSAIISMIKGERFSMTPGEQLWDYLYSEDLAEALVAMSEFGKDGAVYVVGSGQVKPLKEYVKVIRDNIDVSLEIGIGDKEYNCDQVMHLEADISSLTKDTGWVPRTSFEIGIRKLIKTLKKDLLNAK